MNLRIVGPRVLVKVYELPERIGSLFVPECYQDVFDGRTYEVVAVGEKVKELLCVVGESGDTLVPGLSADVAGAPLVLEPDDILEMKGTFRGQHSPEMSNLLGYKVWFVDVIETKNERPTCAIKKVWPSRVWKSDEEPEAA